MNLNIRTLTCKLAATKYLAQMISVALSMVPNLEAVPSKVKFVSAPGLPINVTNGRPTSTVTFSWYTPGANLMITRFVFPIGMLLIASLIVLKSPPPS